AEALGDAESLAMLCYNHGVIYMFLEREGFERGLELAERGMAIAQQAGLELTGIRVARGLAVTYALDGRFEAARRVIDWVMEQIEGTGHRTELSDLYVSARWVRDTVLLFADELDAVTATAAETHAMAVRAPNRTATAGSASVLAQVHFLRG